MPEILSVIDGIKDSEAATIAFRGGKTVLRLNRTAFSFEGLFNTNKSEKFNYKLLRQ